MFSPWLPEGDCVPMYHACFCRGIVGLNLQPSSRGPRGVTEMGYPMYPPSLFRAIHWASKLGVPMYITENGTPLTEDTAERSEWITGYLEQVTPAQPFTGTSNTFSWEATCVSPYFSQISQDNLTGKSAYGAVLPRLLVESVSPDAGLGLCQCMETGMWAGEGSVSQRRGGQLSTPHRQLLIRSDLGGRVDVRLEGAQADAACSHTLPYSAQLAASACHLCLRLTQTSVLALQNTLLRFHDFTNLAHLNSMSLYDVFIPV